MSKKDYKTAVFLRLRLEEEPIDLPTLLGKLGAGFAERTVRRWLVEMTEEGLVHRVGRKRGTRYFAAHVVTTNFLCEGETRSSCFGPASLEVIQQVRRPVYLRAPVGYSEEWLAAYVPNKTSYMPFETRARLHTMGVRAKYHDPAGTYARQIFNRLLIDLSYNSSRLEGNTYSKLETERLVLRGQAAPGKLEEENVMILNHKEAIRYLVDSAHKLVASTEVIRTLHYLLADGLVEREFAGHVRNHPVRISGSAYIPLGAPKRLEQKLWEITQKASLIDDPYEQSLFLLVHVSYLQAFTDVNKRTARLSANIPLILYNLVPLSFNDIDRADYASALIAVYELHDVRPLVDLYVFSYLRTCMLYDLTAKAVGFDEQRVRYRSQRRAALGEIIRACLQKADAKKLAEQRAAEVIPESDRAGFVSDLLEDLDLMDEVRSAGLGVTPEELRKWKRQAP